ncbi:tyrosine-type recombinase/integrase [Flavobacterium sp. HSC-61S13]|uniref:tyrosine-type recombinase/integrase n=1 Tax=Flavobacterium sp. HSC-61S13 TaxID=2910963 RepID=UPI00209D8983|nr:tyrosine-type recombinase/integrase [Flavobacterium sp. HSC-61S13]MCP1996691.1 integrase [Flavobacterium sp. HSC-61S13]
MATVNFFVKGTTNPSRINIRFVHSRSIDITANTELVINPKFWDHKNKRIRNVIEVRNKDEVNLMLSKMQIFIVDEFNNSYIKGGIIDKQWLAKCVSLFFNRPSSEDSFKVKEEEVYLTSFADHWIKQIAPTYKVKANKFMDSKTIRHYIILNNILKEFEGKNKIKLTEVTSKSMDDLSIYLSTRNYSESTIKRMIVRMKFFCARAEETNLVVNKNYKERVFVKEREVEFKEPYLNVSEITKIFQLEIKDPVIDAIRDNFIIGLWTGLRISDFLTKLDISNIGNDIIEIQTTKTGHKVAIPIHAQVLYTLQKRNGNLPPKVLEQHFNREIKLICKECKINEEMLGGKTTISIDPTTKKEVKRKKVDVFKKYELVTSHICRRSFATNLFGEVPNSVIMAVAGWKSEKQMLDYNKQTNIESAMILKKYWDEKKIN